MPRGRVCEQSASLTVAVAERDRAEVKALIKKADTTRRRIAELQGELRSLEHRIGRAHPKNGPSDTRKTARKK